MGVSMKDVARLADVSIATVSNVVNKTKYVNPELEKKVLKAIKDLNYNVNPIARNLRSGNSKIIGLVISDLANPYIMQIVIGIDKKLSPEGYHIIYCNSNEDKKKEQDNIESLLMQNVDGMIIAPVSEDCSYMDQLIGDKCPSVFFDRKPFGFNRDYILTNNFEGAFKGTELLLNKHHEHIGFIGSSFTETMNERANGFRSALEKKGIQPDENLIKFGKGLGQDPEEHKKGDGYSLAKFLVEEKQVSAIFSANNPANIGVITYLKEKSYRIPEDISLVCFDDTFWLSMVDNGITAVDQDRTEIGRTAAEILMKRIKGSNDDFNEYRIPTNLILRSSS